MDINTLLDTYPDYYDYVRIDEFILQLNSPVAPNGQEINHIVLVINNRSGRGCKLNFKCFDQDYRFIGNCIVETTCGIKRLNITGGTNCSHTIQINSANVANAEVHLGNRKDNFSTNFAKATVYAGAGDDRIQGGVEDDVIYGENGNDGIKGFGGNDVLYGGEGEDTLSGMDGNDMLNGGNGSDILDGGSGRDRCEGGDDYSRDIIYGGPGSDRGDYGLYGGPGDDEIWGDYPNIPNYESDTHDYISGGEGDDTIYGGPGHDEIEGGPGNDIIYCGPGNDGPLYTIAGAWVNGGRGNDTIYGEGGDDNLFAGLGVDTIDGGPGLDSGVCGQNTDTAIDIENLRYFPASTEP